MRDFKPRALTLLLCLAGCGRQVVEFGTDTTVVTADAAIADSRVDPADLALADAAALDATRNDATRNDAALADAALPDAVVLDAALNDAALTDAATLDAVLTDAALPDAALPDAALPDAALPTAPRVLSTVPEDQASDVPLDSTVSAVFSDPMDPLTLVSPAVTFGLVARVSGLPVPGTVTYEDRTATFTPDEALSSDTEYIATVTSDALDLAGTALVVPAVDGLPTPNPFTFRTAAVVIPPPPLAINLRGIATFGIASRAGLTSTGVTVVNGDVALYPLDLCADATGNAGAAQTCLVQTYASPTGLTVDGSIYFAGDPFDNGGTANAVTNDLTIAWTAAMNMVDTQGPVIADELGGKILAPGVYHNAALALSAGSVATLDAGNDANAVFVFKVDSSLVDSGTLLLPSRIELVNGAQARNVWFVTGLDVTVGSGTTWNGNILAGRTATILDGSTVMGRVLAGASGAGAITLTGAASPSVTSITVPE